MIVVDTMSRDCEFVMFLAGMALKNRVLGRVRCVPGAGVIKK
jgi:hypothetical protein